MRRLIALFSVILAVSSSTLIAQTTQRLTANKHNEYGLIYSLPITHLKITVTAEKQVSKAGIYYKYAKKYLNSNDAISMDSQQWSLKGITIESYGTPDTDNQYLMQFRSGSTPYLILSENGLPISINYEEGENNSDNKPQNDSSDDSGNSNNSALSQSALSGDFMISESSAKRAEIAAKQIYKIRESRTNLILGEADQMPPDGEAMKLMMSELDKQEQALTALFLGTTESETTTKTFEYTPTSDINGEVIFRLSDFNGIVDKNDLSGEPVYLDIKQTLTAELPVNENGEVKKLPKGAVMYKIPGKASATIRFEGREVMQRRFEVAQFGIDFGLNPSMFTDKKEPAYVIFNPESGSIKELGSASK